VSAPTVRRYPRTMQEAFPGRDASYACAIERHRKWHSVADVIAAVLLAIMLGATLAAWWSS
jgi:hypothetical protein